ncbi:MAG: MSMEG_0570 family nitrogen starvation response protein [Methylobacter tundripaludum]|uniref:Putative repeat protein (TIGR04042 family) n=1 Tax=Methylobacter tundripaludum TaxID=173365 RepID=A0A2S6GTS6_9GAMM|nr:MSMEG_0570 family nitrogen starvation response protein [Methylobacter tundripaludum]MCK9635513.1 MSMEG_0570 family nitrogen starvation response protein [Methylobacter tundripaludum]PPK68648.1 putative repeat protein (TIGR04042 family) [Methylobacter tundripaludum]
MPEMRFRVRWPDRSTSLCYSPSQVIKDFFNPGETYELEDFLARSRAALQIAGERVRQKYGYTCSSAMSQLDEIETVAARFSEIENPKVLVEEFIG